MAFYDKSLRVKVQFYEWNNECYNWFNLEFDWEKIGNEREKKFWKLIKLPNPITQGPVVCVYIVGFYVKLFILLLFDRIRAPRVMRSGDI